MHDFIARLSSWQKFISLLDQMYSKFSLMLQLQPLFHCSLVYGFAIYLSFFSIAKFMLDTNLVDFILENIRTYCSSMSVAPIMRNILLESKNYNPTEYLDSQGTLAISSRLSVKIWSRPSSESIMSAPYFSEQQQLITDLCSHLVLLLLFLKYKRCESVTSRGWIVQT